MPAPLHTPFTESTEHETCSLTLQTILFRHFCSSNQQRGPRVTDTNKAADQNDAPGTIIIARTSAHYPSTGKAGTRHVRTRLPIVGRQVLADHSAYKGDQTCAAGIRACSNCPTRELPSLATSKSVIPNDLSQTERQLQHQ